MCVSAHVACGAVILIDSGAPPVHVSELVRTWPTCAVRARLRFLALGQLGQQKVRLKFLTSGVLIARPELYGHRSLRKEEFACLSHTRSTEPSRTCTRSHKLILSVQAAISDSSDGWREGGGACTVGDSMGATKKYPFG